MDGSTGGDSPIYAGDFYSDQSDEDESPGYRNGDSSPTRSEGDEEKINCSSPKRQKLETLEDLISQLPDCILVDILNRLPDTREAVNTSVLSKRWQYLWTTIPTLNFFQGYREPTSEFVSFVFRTLSRRRHCKIEKFKVCFTDYEAKYGPVVDVWVGIAAACKTEELSLTFGRFPLQGEEPTLYELPEYVLNNSSFTNLRLFNCLIPENGLVSWKMLKKLYMRAKFTDDMIRNLLSGSPVLEVLDLDECYGFTRLDIASSSVKELVLEGYNPFGKLTNAPLKISAPNISSLQVRGIWAVSKPPLLEVPSLDKLVLDFDFDAEELRKPEEDAWKELFQSLLPVRELTLGDRPLEVLSYLELDGWRSPLLRCKCLKMSFIKRSCFPGLINLLRSSPGLESLLINTDSPLMLGCTGSHTRRNYLIYCKRNFCCLRQNLKLVKINFCVKWDRECELVQFLLENACSLEKIIIKTRTHWWKPQSSTSGLPRQAAKKVLSFPRVSKNALVHFG